MLIIGFCFYLLFINLVAFVLFFADKKRAQRGAWRISEKALFTSAFFFGAFGALMGMKIFRHKTKHWYFKYGIPLLLFLQIVLIGYLGVNYVIA